MPHADAMSGNGSPNRDRRERSRNDPFVALVRLLESVRQRGAWRAVALADSAGFLIAGGGLVSECEELAAYGPLLVASPPANDILPSSIEVLTGATIRRISVDGVEILLCASGDGSPELASLDDVEQGAQRILARTRVRELSIG